MLELGRRRRHQPAPPHVVFEALAQPETGTGRRWLELRVDETAPRIVEVDHPHLLVWSSLWPERPEALIRFDLPWDAARQGTDLTWTLLMQEPEPEAPALGYFRKRLNEMINADLRYSFGQ